MDVVQELPPSWRSAVRDVGPLVDASPSAGIPPDQAAVLAVLAVDEATHIEDVIGRSTMNPARVGAALLSLELTGLARQLEGQRWIALRARTESR